MSLAHDSKLKAHMYKNSYRRETNQLYSLMCVKIAGQVCPLSIRKLSFRVGCWM